MTRVLQLVLTCWGILGVAFSPTTALSQVPPNPLQSAYWRFEEGTPFNQVTPRNADVVVDSINDNNMRAFMNEVVDAAPTYVTSVPPKSLKSGLPNNLALDFIPNEDLFSQSQAINNGTISPGGGFTVEAAFNTNAPARFAGIVGKEGRPGLGRGLGFIENLQTFVLKTRADNSLLQVEQWDAAGNLVQVSSLAPLVASQWYYAAVVNDGAMLSLWLDSGSGYELQGSTAVSGALYQGPNPDNPDWDRPWTIGRGEFGGGPADFFDGIIDEVRITNMALSPTQFLFAPPGEDLEGDYNEDGIVDAADYVLWRKNDGLQPGYTAWRANFGMTAGTGSGLTVAAVPEPASSLLVLFAAATYTLYAVRVGNRKNNRG